MSSTLTRAGIFSGVEPDVVAVMTGQLERVSFPRGHMIFREGAVGDRLYIITAGKVKIGHKVQHRNRLIAILGPGDMFGELALLDSGPRTCTVTTQTHVKAVTITRAHLRTWIAECPEVAEHLLQVLVRRLRRTNSLVCDQVFSDVAGRVATLLLDLAGRFGEAGNGAVRIDHELNQNEIAQLAGSTRESVNKALSTFVDRGWIRLQGKTIFICDPAALAIRAKLTSTNRAAPNHPEPPRPRSS